MLWSSLEPIQIQDRLKSLNLALTSPVLGREFVVCLACGYAVSTHGNGVTQHLWEQHHVEGGGPQTRCALKRNELLGLIRRSQ